MREDIDFKGATQSRTSGWSLFSASSTYIHYVQISPLSWIFFLSFSQSLLKQNQALNQTIIFLIHRHLLIHFFFKVMKFFAKSSNSFLTFPFLLLASGHLLWYFIIHFNIRKFAPPIRNRKMFLNESLKHTSGKMKKKNIKTTKERERDTHTQNIIHLLCRGNKLSKFSCLSQLF